MCMVPVIVVRNDAEIDFFPVVFVFPVFVFVKARIEKIFRRRFRIVIALVQVRFLRPRS